MKILSNLDLQGNSLQNVGNLNEILNPYIEGLKVKNPVECATIENIDLTQTVSTIDGSTLTEGDRVLVISQTTPSENGIYIVGADSKLTRSLDANTWSELYMSHVFVHTGTVNGGKSFRSQTASTGTLDTDSITFAEFAATGEPVGYTPTRVLYVDGNRTDTYTANGSINKPFKTIQAAINSIGAATDATTYQQKFALMVESGDYSSENLIFPHRSIAIFGQGVKLGNIAREIADEEEFGVSSSTYRACLSFVGTKASDAKQSSHRAKVNGIWINGNITESVKSGKTGYTTHDLVLSGCYLYGSILSDPATGQCVTYILDSYLDIDLSTGIQGTIYLQNMSNSRLVTHNGVAGDYLDINTIVNISESKIDAILFNSGNDIVLNNLELNNTGYLILHTAGKESLVDPVSNKSMLHLAEKLPDSRVASNANIVLANTLTEVNGVTLVENDYVVLQFQTDPIENGLYLYNKNQLLERILDDENPLELNRRYTYCIGRNSYFLFDTLGTTGTDPIAVINFYQHSLIKNYDDSNKKFTATVGDNSSTTFQISHNLNDYDITISVRKWSTGEIIYPDIVIMDANKVQLTINPAPLTNDVKVVILG